MPRQWYRGDGNSGGDGPVPLANKGGGPGARAEGGGEGTARNRRLTRRLTIALIWFFSSRAILSVFFILPWSALTRARSLMIAVNALLAGTNVLFLFWSTYTAFSGDDWQEEPPSATDLSGPEILERGRQWERSSHTSCHVLQSHCHFFILNMAILQCFS